MLARLLLALLLAAFAMPGAAPAACHADTAARHAMPVAGHHVMPDRQPDRPAAAVHACIGCVPPSDWLSPRIALPMPAIAARPVALRATVLTGAAASPDLPPPRRG